MTPELRELLGRVREWMKDREVKTLTPEGMTWCSECASHDCECAVLARDIDAALAEPPKTVTVYVCPVGLDGLFYVTTGDERMKSGDMTEQEAETLAASLVGKVIERGK